MTKDRARGIFTLGQLDAALLTHSQLAVSHSSPKRLTFLVENILGQQHPCACQPTQKLQPRGEGNLQPPLTSPHGQERRKSRVEGKEGHSQTHTDCRVTALQLPLAESPTSQQSRRETLAMVGHGSRYALLYKSFSEDLPAS